MMPEPQTIPGLRDSVAKFNANSAWKQLPDGAGSSSAPSAPWKLRFLGVFLLVDAVFVAFHGAVGVLTLPSNYSTAQRVFTYTFNYSAQFLAAFVVGLILSLVYGLLSGQVGRQYRARTWTRALLIALVPAALLAYGSWLGVHNPV